MRLPTWEELVSVEEQLEVLEHPLDQSLFVAGPPGSGKTVLAVYRAQMVAEAEAAQTKTKQPIPIVTFSRMLRRLLVLLDEESGTYAKTMHSFVRHDYRDRINMNPPNQPDDQYAYDWNVMFTCLDNISASPDRQHLVVDEGQDLPEEFFRYVSRYVSRRMTVFADDDQALGERRTTLEQIKDAAGLDGPVILQRNHRNTPEIARVAEHFHSGRLPAASVLRAASRELPRLIRSPNLESTAELVSNWCQTRGGSIGVIVNRNDTGSILRRKLQSRLPEHRIDIYRNNKRNEDSIDMLAPGITVLNKESVKGQEFDAVFILELEAFIPCTDEVMRRGMYMMCSRARDNLFLVYGPQALSVDAATALPGSDVLERPGRSANDQIPTPYSDRNTQ